MAVEGNDGVETLRSCSGSACPTLVLTFDHVRGQKRFTISDRLFTMLWDRLLEEIAKCEVVCANCHMRRTARRAGYYLDLA